MMPQTNYYYTVFCKSIYNCLKKGIFTILLTILRAFKDFYMFFHDVFPWLHKTFHFTWFPLLLFLCFYSFASIPLLLFFCFVSFASFLLLCFLCFVSFCRISSSPQKARVS